MSSPVRSRTRSVGPRAASVSWIVVFVWALASSVSAEVDVAESPEPMLAAERKLLADAGFDLNQLEGMRARNSRPLTAADSVPMRQMLAVVDRWDQLDLAAVPANRVLNLLSDTQGSVGRRVQFNGRVRQCVPLMEGAGEATGYQLTVFPNLGQSIVVKGADGKRVTYPRFAVTVRTSRLPLGTALHQMAGQQVRVDGLHYRFWRYDSAFAAANRIDGQIGPLVLAGSIRTVLLPNSSPSDWIAGAAVCVVVGLLGLGWWYGRRQSLAGRSSDALPDMLPEDWRAGDGVSNDVDR